MANNATQLTDTYASHGNGPRKCEMATTSNKFGCRPGSGHIYIPPNATIKYRRASYSHDNGPQKCEMATTSKKFGYRPGSGHIYIPPNATIQQLKPRKLQTNTQNIVEPLKPTAIGICKPAKPTTTWLNKIDTNRKAPYTFY